MSNRRFLPILILILTLVGSSAAGTAIFLLYRTAFDVQRERLMVLARSHARLVETAIAHEAAVKPPGKSRKAIQTYFAQNQQHPYEFGRSGEIVFGQLENDHIRYFFQSSRKRDFPNPAPIDSPWAGPMRQALFGNSGALMGTDDRGQRVLAVYEPVRGHPYGVVTKIDLAEIRQPYVRAAATTGGITLAIILAGAFFFTRATQPVIRRLRESEVQYRNLFDGSISGIVILSEARRVVLANQAFAEIFGYDSAAEVLNKRGIDFIAPDEHDRMTALFDLRMSGEEAQTRYEYQGLRKDGSLIWIDRMAKKVTWQGRPAIQATFVDITARVRADEELRASQRLLRAVIDTVPHAIYVKDPQGRFLMVNATMAALHSHTAEEMVGLSRKEMNSGTAEELRELEARDRRVVETRLPVGATDVRLTRRDGTVSLRDSFKAPLLDQQGEVTAIVGISQDVTQRRNSEALLRESEAKFRDLVEGSIQGIIISQNRTVMFANQAYAEIFGYGSVAEVLNMRSWEFVAPHERERVGQYSAQRYAGQDVPKRYEYEGVRKDGSFIWVERLIQFTTWQGQVALQMTIIDITERRRAEEQQRMSRQLLRAVIDAVPFAIGVKDLDGRFLIANKAVGEIHGLPPEEVLGHTTTELPGGSEEEKAGILAAEAEVIRTGQMMVRTELPITGVDGTLHIRNFYKVPLFDEHQQVTAVVGIGEDVTERKAIENQLHQAQKMEAIGHLTGGVAHDFNNLLQVVLGNLEMLEEGLGGNEQLLRYAQRATGAARRGAGLTHHLLAYSRKQKLDSEPTDINQIIGELNKLLHRTLGGAVQVMTYFGGDLWESTIDPNQMQTALLNLSLNARDAMPRGGKLIFETSNRTLGPEFGQAHPGLPLGDYAVVTVSDTGGGIAADQIDRVWEPFYTTKDVGRGSGLGLSMVYGFVKQSGGHVEIESELGQGTTVRLFLPRTPPDTAPIAAGEEEAGEIRFQGRGEIVLVVEDDNEVRAFAADVLPRMGFKVLQAKDAAGAMELLGGMARVDLLLTDIVMPGGINGVDLAAKARTLRPGLRVVFTSGFADETVVRSLSLQDDAAFLPKPFGRADLARILRKVLGAGSAGG